MKAFAKMQLDESGYEKLSDDPKAVHCAELATKYQRDVQNLTKLSKTLEESSDFVNLFDVLNSHNITDRSRVDSYASEQITKAVSSFVGKGIYDEFASCASKHFSSSKHTVHKIVGCKFQQEVSTYIARATVDTATRGTDEHTRLHIKEALLAQFFVIWSSICVPLIEAERKSVQDDLNRCNGLLSLVKKTTKLFLQDLGDAAEDAAFRSFMKSVCTFYNHTIARIRADDWFVSSKLMWQLNFENVSTKVFASWIREKGQLLRNALSRDFDRLQRLCKEPADSTAWHGIEVIHTIDDPINAFRFRPPSYVGRFETPSGRVYAKYTQTTEDSITRALTLIQTFWFLHDIIQRDWLPIQYVSANYAHDLVESEIQLYSQTVRGITKELTRVCRDAGYNIEEERFDRVVFEICSKYAGRSHNSASASGAIRASGAASSNCVDSFVRTSSSSTYGIPTKAPNDTLCASRDKSIPFLPSFVHWHGLVDYLVIHTVAENVSESIDRGRGRGVVSTVEIRNEEIMTAVETDILNLVKAEKCSEMRHILVKLANRDRLRQSIPVIIKNLIDQGEKGCEASNNTNSGQDVVWFTSYTAEIAKKGTVLKIGYGSSDPLAFLFYNLCSRLKSWMDQSWPLPAGVEWKVKRPRVSTAAVIHDTVLNTSPVSGSSALTVSPRS